MTNLFDEATAKRNVIITMLTQVTEKYKYNSNSYNKLIVDYWTRRFYDIEGV